MFVDRQGTGLTKVATQRIREAKMSDTRGFTLYDNMIKVDNLTTCGHYKPLISAIICMVLIKLFKYNLSKAWVHLTAGDGKSKSGKVLILLVYATR